MSKEEVLAEHFIDMEDATAAFKIAAVTDNKTQFLSGVPLDDFKLRFGIDYDQELQSTSVSLIIKEEDLFNLANALAGAGYKLREARVKAKREK